MIRSLIAPRRKMCPTCRVADRFFNDFVEDLEALNIVTVSKFARVSKYVHESSSLVLELVEAGKAYPVAGNVYFDTSKADHFGKLSHQSEFESEDEDYRRSAREEELH